MKYKIKSVSGRWMVIEGYLKDGAFREDDIPFASTSIADCYAWIKAKEEGLNLNF
jgi:hypothetical protein